MADNRGSPRIRTDALVDVAGTDVLLFHRIRDLSVGGMSIESPVLEAVGTEVDLSINFPDLGEVLETRGVVVRTTESPRVMGIRFVGLSRRDTALLQRYLDLKTRHEGGGHEG